LLPRRYQIPAKLLKTFSKVFGHPSHGLPTHPCSKAAPKNSR
jgi:hypothetical protein